MLKGTGPKSAHEQSVTEQSHSEESEQSCYKCGGRFLHDNQGCPAAGYKCEVCLRYGHYNDFCDKQSRGKVNSKFIGTQRGGWRGERDQHGDIVDIVVIMQGQTM